jgi:septal ring factor EnvC (AmiA/AmiB activator)
MSRRTARLGAAVLAFGLLTAAADANDPERRVTEGELQQTEEALRHAEAERRARLGALSALQSELLMLSTAMQVAVADLRQHEKTIIAIGESLKDLEGQRNARQAELEQRRVQAGGVVAALVRLTALPPEAALMGHGSSDDRLRTALLLRGLAPRLEERAALLADDIANIHKAEAKIAAEQERLAAAKLDLQRRYRALAEVVSRKDKLVAAQADSVDKTAAIAKRLAKSAASLRELLGRVDAERAARLAAINAERQRRSALALARGLQPAAPDGPPLRLAGLLGREGGLIAPVNGRVVYRFGEGEGRFTEGVTLSAEPDTPVLSPADGRVVYAGPFRDYGILLIIEHGGGFHSVLTGLGGSGMVAGQWVLGGEPLGLTAQHGSLYVEIRQNGSPVDPLAWFTVDRS